MVEIKFCCSYLFQKKFSYKADFIYLSVLKDFIVYRKRLSNDSTFEVITAVVRAPRSDREG